MNANDRNAFRHKYNPTNRKAMAGPVRIICENTGKSLYAERGTPLTEVLKMVSIKNPYPFLAAYVNNEIRELGYEVYVPVTVRFIDITHFEGMRVYQRTLFFILHKAVTDTFPERTLKIRNSVSKGFYCELDGVSDLPVADVERIRDRMGEIVRQNIPIVWERVTIEEAEKICQEYGFEDKIRLMRTRPHLYVSLYRLADLPGYFYGALAPSTGYIHLFDLRKYYDGMYLAVPCRTAPDKLAKMIPQSKMFEIFHEYKAWMDVLGVATLGELNSNILDGRISELVKIAEAFHEKKLARLADTVCERNRNDGTRLVLISGPSSSGKTTCAKRLGIQLRVVGLEPVTISLDDYFVDRDKTPRDENGEHDYEALEAVNVELFNEHLLRLMKGEEVSVPRYDFVSGKSISDSHRLKLNEKSIILIEGIHALNPGLTPLIDDALKFKIYTSAFTSLSMDNLMRISTTDNRLLRRIVRDSQFRGNSATETIRRWQSVRRGEEKHIFPYQEEADVMFNSALFFELCILKTYAEPLLQEVPNTVPEYAEAKRLLEFLDLFIPIPDTELPPTSILREFVGGSSFVY